MTTRFIGEPRYKDEDEYHWECEKCGYKYITHNIPKDGEECCPNCRRTITKFEKGEEI